MAQTQNDLMGSELDMKSRAEDEMAKFFSFDCGSAKLIERESTKFAIDFAYQRVKKPSQLCADYHFGSNQSML